MDDRGTRRFVSTSARVRALGRDCSSFSETVDYVTTFLHVAIIGSMCPFSVTIEHVPDRELGPLVARLSEAGFANPIITHVGADGPSDGAGAAARLGSPDLPEA